MDETWFHHYTPEANWQAAEWTAKRKNRPKRPKTQVPASKVLAPVFWDAHGILFIDFLEKGRPINSEYYMVLLVRLKEEIAKNNPKRRWKKCFYAKTMQRVISPSQQWQNCTNDTLNCFPIHRILRIWLAVTNTCLQILKECSRERNFAPMKKWLPKLKRILRPRNKSFDKKGIEMLEKRWKECITLEGHYVDKQSPNLTKSCCCISHPTN